MLALPKMRQIKQICLSALAIACLSPAVTLLPVQAVPESSSSVTTLSAQTESESQTSPFHRGSGRLRHFYSPRYSPPDNGGPKTTGGSGTRFRFVTPRWTLVA